MALLQISSSRSFARCVRCMVVASEACGAAGRWAGGQVGRWAGEGAGRQEGAGGVGRRQRPRRAGEGAGAAHQDVVQRELRELRELQQQPLGAAVSDVGGARQLGAQAEAAQPRQHAQLPQRRVLEAHAARVQVQQVQLLEGREGGKGRGAGSGREAQRCLPASSSLRDRKWRGAPARRCDATQACHHSRHCISCCCRGPAPAAHLERGEVRDVLQPLLADHEVVYSPQAGQQPQRGERGDAVVADLRERQEAGEVQWQGERAAWLHG
jgi:hypothetical protein